MTIDDSGLFHGSYDPVKAHEYYLKKRQLKGRSPAATKPTSSRTSAPSKAVAVRPAGGKPNRADTKSRQAELKAQKEALQKRLEHLRDVLSSLVDAAKKRSGDGKNDKNKAPETQADKADRNKAAKDAKPLSAKQKHDKAQAAKKAYEKEHPTSLSHDVDILKAQVADIQAKIQKAVEDARARRNKASQHANN